MRKMVSSDEKLSVRAQCELLEIHRSGFYYKPCAETEQNEQIMRLMDERQLDKPTHGVLQMQDYLRDQGLLINHKRVRRLLRLMGLMAIYPQRNLSKLGFASYIHPYLLKGLSINRSNQVWEIDITYIPMKKGFMYLTAIIDVYSRYVVNWGLSNSLEAKESLSVVKSAIQRHGAPEIINSDQGSQFTCQGWIEYLQEQKIKISMDGKGRALDNIYIERLWRTVKRDYVYLFPALDGRELHHGLTEFFNEYNYKKYHLGIGRTIPFQKYQKQVA